MKKTFLTVLLSLSLFACTNSSDLGTGKSGKKFMVKGYTYDQIWNASLDGLSGTYSDQKLDFERSLTVAKKDKSAGRIEANSDIGMWSFGEVVGVFISPAKNAPEHTIEVESRSKLKTNITNNNWEDEVITSINNELLKIKSN